MGLVFFLSGLSWFLDLAKPPDNLPENLVIFMRGLEASGYFLYLLKGTEVICGLLLIIGAFVPLALVALAPVILNIFLTHLFLAPSGVPLAVIIGLLEIYLAFFAKPYSDIVKQIFRCPMKESLMKKA